MNNLYNASHLTTLSQIQTAVLSRLDKRIIIVDETPGVQIPGSVVYNSIYVSREVVVDITLRNYSAAELTVTAPNGIPLEMTFIQHGDFPEIYVVALRAPPTRK